MSPDLQGKLNHRFVPKAKRNVEGGAVRTTGNTSNATDKYSLRYTPLKNTQLCCTIFVMDHVEETNRVSNQIQGVLLNGTSWEGLTILYFGYWPTATILYHGQDAPCLSLLTDKSRQTLKKLGTG